MFLLHLNLPRSARASTRTLTACLPITFTQKQRQRFLRGSTATIITRMATTHPSLSVVSTPDAPGAIGPYSQAIKVGDLLFVSGCIPIDPSTGEVVQGIEEQTKQALKNLEAVVKAGGSEIGKVVKTTVFLKSMDDFVTVNEIYAAAFGNHRPARSAVEVSRLPKDVLIEVECIAR
ncbi:hypothetical protein D9757_008782 [Collybiopsis confluens]|uniref:YjgF-like protein n=1 Tax=Collybiopsis confluens TaxID=2823264 RepID=A0A8H5H5I8_9AGAR|nr:hypothetical protein D9757_008782 [Collybiopsis confluens]